MDPTTAAVLFGAMALLSGGIVAVDLYRRRRELRTAAKKLGFSVVDIGLNDAYVKPRFAQGTVAGVRARVGYLAASATEPSQERRSGALFHLVCGVEISRASGYVMSRARPLQGEMSALRSLGFRNAEAPKLSGAFLFMERSIDEATWLRNEQVAEVLIELSRTYSVVRVYQGWLWVGNDATDLDHLDVDFDNLVEARRKIEEAI